MPNPVAVNDLQPISGSLQTSRISYAVEIADKNYGQDYNSTTWYSDIPNNGQFYTIISDNYTANYYVSRSNAEGAYVEGGLPAVDEYSAPVFWVTPGTSSLDIITIVNGLPDRRGQIPFNSGSQALNWVASSSNYFAVGPNYYEQIDADQLRLYLDASQIISYPTTQSTWYDLSGYSSKGTLVNNPTFNANGWITFDGTDDYVNFFNNNLLNIGTSNFSQTVNFLINTTSAQRITFKRLGSLGYGYSMFIDGSGALGFEILTPSTFIIAYGGYPSTGRWHQATFSLDRSGNGILYLDGIPGTPVNFSSLVGLDISNSEDFVLGAVMPSIGGAYLNGNLSTVASYAKQLSAAEVAQNYYGGPIVTDGLVFAVDAGNLVSYPRTGTSWYNLTGSVNGTLTNGPAFSPADGGELIFDGTDDYVDFGSPTSLFNPATSTMTMMGWIYVKNNQTNILIGLQESGAGSLSLGTNSSGNVRFICRPTAGSQGTIDSSATLALNTWYHIAMTKDTANSISDCTLWINGVAVNTASSTVNFPTSTSAIRSAVYLDSLTYSNINIGIIQVYNRALTSAEILQNYNATK
jgi:hypothetical protein